MVESSTLTSCPAPNPYGDATRKCEKRRKHKDKKLPLRILRKCLEEKNREMSSREVNSDVIIMGV